MRRCAGFHWSPSLLRWPRRAPLPRPGGCLLTSERWCPSLRIPSVAFSAPRSNTHEDLAYASCPICGTVAHMCDMLTHLTTVHRELSPDHCRRICRERLALYHRVIGVPLKKFDLTSSGRRVLDFLPTLLPTGYLCNWCETKRDVHATRDRFLRHVADAHAEIDLDEVEAHVPLLPRAPEDSAEAGAITARPTRRIAGAPVAVPETFVPAPMPPRQVGVSVPRGVDRAPVAALSDADFPCELCGRGFLSEADLLQHLETRHPEGTATAATDVETSTAIAEVAQFTSREATLGGDQRIRVVCDLCPSSRVYTMPSALFSHIRFKHPGEDASYHVERLIRAQDKTPSFVCQVCKKAFASASALDGHFKNKHVELAAEATEEAGRVVVSNCWWCHDCEKGFASAKGLHGHMQSKHGLSTQAHPCPACKRIFSDVFSLEEHITLLHKTISLSDLGLQSHAQCPKCERCFLTYEDLHRHAVKHHKKDPRDPVRQLESASPISSNVSATVSAGAVSAVKAEPQGPRKVKRRKKSDTAEGSTDS